MVTSFIVMSLSAFSYCPETFSWSESGDKPIAPGLIVIAAYNKNIITIF